MRLTCQLGAKMITNIDIIEKKQLKPWQKDDICLNVGVQSATQAAHSDTALVSAVFAALSALGSR